MSNPFDQDCDDPWLVHPGLSDGAQSKPEASFLQIETIAEVEPLDTQLGVFPKKTVPDPLHDALLSQPEATDADIAGMSGDTSVVATMQTYAILDAAKIMNLPELLEDSGLEYRCLFKGHAYDELKDVAPWIVRLEEGNSFTCNLFTRSDAHWHLWDNEPGIYIRSRGSLDDMWRHFRKFTRIKDESGKWFYFRFWESPVNTTLISMGWSNETADLVLPLFGRGQISAFVLPTGFGQWRHLYWCGQVALPQKPAILSHGARRLMRRLRQVFEFEKLAQVSMRHVAQRQKTDPSEAMSALRSRRDQFLGLGFWRRDHLAKLCCWELMLGPGFIDNFDGGSVSNIMDEHTLPEVKILKIDTLLSTILEGAVRNDE